MKKHKASILAMTVIILSIILTTALAVSLAAIKQKNASLGSGKSNLAFQNADKGVEEVMNDIMTRPMETVDKLSNCSGGKIVGTGYVVTLKKNDIEISCSDSTTYMADLTSIKSTGTGANQEQRAIEAAVAAGLDWTSITSFGNGWRLYTNSTWSGNELACAKDSRTGIVYLKGIADNAALQSSCGTAEAMTLPTACRPNVRKLVMGEGNNNSSWMATRLDITTDGKILVCDSGRSYISLEGIFFPTN